MAATFVNCFKEELLCFLCLEVFVDPVRLPCHHNFCRQCVVRSWSANEDVVLCPECNMPYYVRPPLAKNLKLANIVASFKALDAVIPKAVPEDAECVPSHSQASCGTEELCDHMKHELQKHQEKLGEHMVEGSRTATADKRQAEESFQETREMVKAGYKKMHELLVQDMHRTLHDLDTAHSQFSAQVSELHERQQEGEQLLSCVQVALNRVEDLNFMKDIADTQILLNRSEAYTSGNPPLLNQGEFKLCGFLKMITEKEKTLQELLEGSPSTLVDIPHSAVSQSRPGPSRAIKRKRPHGSTAAKDNGCDSSCFEPVKKKQYTTQQSAGSSYAPGPLSAPGPSSPSWTNSAPGPSSHPCPSSAPGHIPGPSSHPSPSYGPGHISAPRPSSHLSPSSVPDPSSPRGRAPH